MGFPFATPTHRTSKRLLETAMTKSPKPSDSDARKGAVEPDTHQGPASSDPKRPDLHGNLSDQLPHRNSDAQLHALIDEGDTDFPEPGSSPEHSGQKNPTS